MSNSHLYGDRPIVYDDADFTMSEAARLSGVEEKTIRNWIARDVTDAGTKFGGRWAFSFNDILKLKVAGYLVGSLCLEASAAAKIAKEAGRMVAARALEQSERNPATGKLIELETGFEHWQAVLVSFKDGNATFWTAGCDPSRRDPPRYSNIDHASLRRPYIVIPSDSIISELFFDIEDVWTDRDNAASSPFDEAERFFLKNIEALDRDDEGREVFIGLSYDETIEYRDLSRGLKSDRRADRQRYFDLNEKHERARLLRLGAKVAARQ